MPDDFAERQRQLLDDLGGAQHRVRVLLAAAPGALKPVSDALWLWRLGPGLLAVPKPAADRFRRAPRGRARLAQARTGRNSPPSCHHRRRSHGMQRTRLVPAASPAAPVLGESDAQNATEGGNYESAKPAIARTQRAFRIRALAVLVSLPPLRPPRLATKPGGANATIRPILRQMQRRRLAPKPAPPSGMFAVTLSSLSIHSSQRGL